MEEWKAKWKPLGGVVISGEGVTPATMWREGRGREWAGMGGVDIHFWFMTDQKGGKGRGNRWIERREIFFEKENKKSKEGRK